MSDFPGLRILLLEDESAIAILVEDMLAELGCELVASVGRVSEANSIAETAALDLAVLDVNVAGERPFTVCETLRSRGIPFIFSTGYGSEGLPPAYQGARVLRKPFTLENLRAELELLQVSPQIKTFAVQPERSPAGPLD